jgi:hypothetical protein
MSFDDSDYWDGKIDEVRLFNRALTPSEVEGLYHFAPGPVGYWKLDENIGLTANDSSGNGRSGTISDSTALWKNGKYGSAIKFDGYTNSDYINIPDNDAFSPVTTGAFTVETWVNLQSFPDDSFFVNKRAGSNYEWYLGITDTKAVLAHITNPDGSTSYMSTVYGFPTIQTNTWYHLAFTFDNSLPLLKLYLNGILVASDNTTSGAYSNGTAPLRIGCEGAGVNCPDSHIDDVKIYNYARTPEQILLDMGNDAPNGASLLHYKFNEGSGTMVYNSITNSLNGTIANATWTNSGKFDKALQFNGTTSYVNLGNVPALDFEYNQPFSFDFWIKPDNFSNYRSFISKRNGSYRGYWFGYHLGNNRIGLQLISTLGSNDRGAYWNTPPTGTWTHISLTNDGVNVAGIKLFYNGILQTPTSTWDTLTATINNSSNVDIGVDSFTQSTDYFLGTMDDVKIYNFALTPDQVKNNFNQSSSVVVGAPDSASAGTAPIGYWNFDENSGHCAYDTSGNGHTLNIDTNNNSNLGLWTWIAAKAGSGINLNQAHYDITFATDGECTGSSNYTTGTYDVTTGNLSGEFWLKKNSEAYDMAYFNKKSNWASNAPGYVLHNWSTGNDGNMCLYISDSADQYEVCTINNVFALNTWYHVAFVVDKSDVAKTGIYINGQWANNSTGGTLASVGSLTNTEYFNAVRSPNGNPFNAQIDTMQLFDYARTPAQIAYDYNKGAPLAHYKFNECTGAVAHDSTGNNLSGTIIPNSGRTTGTCSSGTSTEMWNGGTTGKLNGSLAFDGAGDYISVTDPGANSVLDIQSSGSLSVWVKLLSDTASTKTIIAKGIFNYYLDVSSEELIEGSFNLTNSLTSNSAISINQWHHLAFVFDDSTDTQKIYIDGILNNTQTGVTETPTVNNDALHIGEYTDSEYFSGQLDDVQIFNYPLSESQIKSVMNDGSVNFQ